MDYLNLDKKRIAIIGGGVIGRTAAYALQQSGYDVTVITDKTPEETVSLVAGGIWKPAYAEPKEKLIRWANETYDWYKTIPDHATANNGLRWIPAVLHLTDYDSSIEWARRVPDLKEVENPIGLRDEIRRTFHATIPAVDMGYFLAWLMAESAKLGVKEVFRHLDSVTEAEAYGDLVIVATGLETSKLIPKSNMYPIQGQVVRVKNPGGIGYRQFNTKEESLYIIPRVDDVVIGGTHVEYASGLEVDLDLQQAMLERAFEFEPRLRAQPIVKGLVGLRPGRSSVRVDFADGIIHAYGHGGSGVTTAWGTALEILELVKLSK
jgi:D-amino-acid oxidase